MSDIKQSDVLVYFLPEGESKAIPAESQSTLDSSDTLTKDFVAGRFFTTDNFTLSLSLSDDEGDNALTPEDEQRSYARWRGLKPSQPKPVPPFQAEPEDVSLSRMIDSSSPVLLSHCLEFKPFDKVVIAKRARVGATGVFATVVRLEFSRVWIRAIEWEDNDAVKETVKFKFNAVTGTFVKRKPSGAVDSPWPFNWSSLEKAG